MNHQTHKVHRGALAPGTYRYIVDTSVYTLVAFQWVQFAAVGSVSSIKFYSTADTNGPEVGTNISDPTSALLAPTANPRWSATPIAFTTLPAAAVGSELLPVTPPGPFVMLEVVVGVAVTDLELRMWGQGQ